MRTSPRRILIYRLGSLGDTVVALPCFHKVRESFPTAEITLLTNRPVVTKAAPVEAVLGSTYFYDHVLDYPVGMRNPRLLIRLIQQIRSLRIDTVVNVTAARSAASTTRDKWFFRAAGVSQLVGFPERREDFDVCLDPATNEYEWEAKRLARRIESLGTLSLEADQYWDLRLTEGEINTANQVLGDALLDKPMLAICVGTKMQSKDWGADNWLNLIDRLGRMLPGWVLVVVGAADEAELGTHCLRAWNGLGVNLCGHTSPRVSAAVLKRATVFVGHDSGPMHLAACVGVPCVAVFSARNLPRQWFPRGHQNQIIYHRTDCAGCNLEVCIDQQKKCILSITPNEVQEAVMSIVNKQA